MMRTWILYVGGLLCYTTRTIAAVPNVDELLARYRENTDKYCGSFVCKVLVTEESDVRMVPDPTLHGGRHVWYESRDCRWDGHRLSSHVSSWGTRESIPPIQQEDPQWSHNLFDLNREAHYMRPGKDQAELLVYSTFAPLRRDLRSLALETIGGPSVGYFSGKFLDDYLHEMPSVRQRARIETINGSQCYVLDVVGRSKYENCTIWIDPSRGHNIAKYEQVGQTSRSTIWNVGYKLIQGAWVPVETRCDSMWTDPAAHTDITICSHIKITEFLVNPDHDALESFVLENVPNGTRVQLIGGDGSPLPGEYVWQGGKPVPHLDKEVIDRLNTIAISLDPDASRGAVSPSDIGSSGKKFKGPYCGLYCMYLLMRISGQDPNMLDLIKPQYVDMRKGSTLSSLAQAAEDAGLYAKVVDRANGRMLRTCPYSMILHVRGSRMSQKYDHYMLFLGSQAGRARICDPPESVKEMSFAELESRWDGKALVVSTKAINLSAIVWTNRIRLGAMSGIAVLCIVLARFVQRHIPYPRIFLRPSLEFRGRHTNCDGIPGTPY